MTREARTRLTTGVIVAVSVAVTAVLYSPGVARGQVEATALIPNGSFEKGTGALPEGWQVEGKGEWVTSGAHSGRRCVALEGQKGGSVYWYTRDVKWAPSRLYQFSFWARAQEGTTGGCLVSGPVFINDDRGYSSWWRQERWVFLTPPRVPANAYLRVGVWSLKGKVFFDDLSLLPAQALHRRFGELELGQGESVEGKEYRFSAPLNSFGNNYSRALADFNAGFNSNRWVFSPGAYVIYRHELPGVKMTAAKVGLTLNYYVKGTCVVEASGDGKKWEQLGMLEGLKSAEFALPEALFPAKVVYVRLRSPGLGEKPRKDSAPGSFQVNVYDFRATLDRDLGRKEGATTFVTEQPIPPTQRAQGLSAKVVGLENTPGRRQVTLQVANRGTSAASVRAEVTLTPDEGGKPLLFSTTASVPAGGSKQVVVPWRVTKVGGYQMDVRVLAGDRIALVAKAGGVAIPEIEDASFGYLIASDGAADLWWCEGSWKVGLERAAPSQKRAEMYVEAARDEFEPVQLVVRPRRALTGLKVSISDFKGADRVLPSSIMSVRQVAYVRITRPTDRFGCKGYWPDPLPPVKGPLTAEAGQNLPLWLTVHVPRLARPGVYRATVTLTADGGWRAQVPLRLRVFSFSMPSREYHVQTALGLSQGNIWRYHNLTGLEDEALREKVWDLYMQDWRDHHISPYSFWTRGFKVNITGYDWGGGEYDRNNPHGGTQALKVVDETPTGNPSALMRTTVAVDPTKDYLLRFWARTATDGQEFMVTLGQHEASGRWISGHNIDIVRKGSKQWRLYEVKIGPANMTKSTRFLDVTLRGSRWREDGSTVGTTWYDDVYFGLAPDGPNLLLDPGFEKTPADVKVSIDWSEWDRQAAKYLDGYHFNSFRVPVMGLGGGRYPNYDRGRLGPFRFGTPEYERLMRDYLLQLQNHLEEKGWLNKAYLYWYDEPGTKDYEFVVERMKLIKRLAPKLTRMLTEQPEKPLFGAVDLWCPVLHAYRPEALQARQKLGERVWWYVCCGPKAPWLGLFIDHPHTDMRAWLWATWKWKVQGCLIWATNWWTTGGLFGAKYQNPWEDPMSYTSTSKPGAVGYWGNGDGRFLYPPNRQAWRDQQTKYVEGPVDCYRWEQLRDGIEDYEYLWALRDAIQRRPNTAAARRAAALLEVPTDIMGENAIRYTPEPRPILEHRHKVALALEELRR
ncbi:MAG: DUF4091 domain-containing protein [Armatimonadetes bacterium]|nr:DUF4091 domain-containing protein [Armatimonadota bacterium]